MGFLLKALLLLFFVLLAGAVAALALVLEDRPAVPGGGFAAADLREARVFIENSDPRNLQPGELSEFTISERDLELLLNYLLENLHGGRSQVDLAAGTAELHLSARQPVLPLGDYVNLRVVLTQQSGMLVLDSLQAGGIVLPGWIANPLMHRAHVELRERVPEYRAALAAVDSFSIDNDRLKLVYQWRPEVLEQLSSRGSELLLSDSERERLVLHLRHLRELLTDPALPERVPLVDILGPMFALARDRGGDPVEENRAVLVVLSLYVSETGATQLFDTQEQAPQLPQRELLLAGRHDYAQHFLISAGLTVSAGTGVAQSVGLLKEVDDSQDGGSGFSFIDIGADRTGIRFGELAVAGTEQARTLQERLAGEVDESLFMANFRDLPEFLSEAAFREAYGGVGEPAYDAVVQDIEARIDQMPLFLP